MITDRDWDRLVRYVTGECEPAEARETFRWINSDPERVRVADELSSLHRAGGTLPRHWNVDAAWQKVLAPAPQVQRLPARRRVLASVERPVRFGARIAAGIVIAISAGLFWAFAIRGRTAASDAQRVAMREVTTQRGQLLQLRLNDGTRITLGPVSRIRYASAFGSVRQIRDVYLEGQALFDVTHDPSRPFHVHTRRAVAADIGTRFVMTSYAEGTVDRVAIAEGTVALRARDARDSVVLDRGDVGAAGPGVALTANRDVDLSADTAWTKGRLVFRDMPLRDVARDLSRWYDIDIRLANGALGARLLTASVGDAPLDAMLADVARTLKLRVERVGQVVRLFEQ